MSNPIYAATHAQFMPLVQPLGFRCIENRYYYRIVGDVVQQFCVLCLHRQCTIRFCMSSVYEENDRKREGAEVYTLIDGTKRWIVESSKELAPSVFATDERLLQPDGDYFAYAAARCTEVLQKVLLPWFEANTTPKQAMEAMRTVRAAEGWDMQKPQDKDVGFLLATQQWAQAAAILNAYFVTQTVPCNRIWRDENAAWAIPLCHALQANDLPFVRAYMDKRKAETCRAFKWKQI